MQQKKNTILTTSTANGRAAHTIPTFIKRITMMLVLIVSFALGARAQSVIMSGDYFLTHNVEGTSVNDEGTKTFNPATCLWQFAQDNYIRPADNNGNAITSNNNYLQYTSLTLGNDGFNWYRARNNESIYHRTGTSSYNRTYYYLRLNGTNWQISNNNSNNGKLIQVTITNNIPLTITNPTINGNDVLTATGNYTYTASGAAYQAGGYTKYYFNSEYHYYNSDNTAITPEAATLSETTWSISANEYATINSSGVVTVNSIPTSDVTLTITATVAVTDGIPAAPAGTTLVGTKEITIQGSVPAAPTISVSGTTVTLQTDATGTTSIRYTIDGTEPTATSGTVYNGAFDISGSTNSPVTIKAITIRNGNVSSVTTQQVKLTLPEPTIKVDGAAGTATITCSNSSATIYYTTDGSAPSATNGTPYNGQITGLATMATVKAIAICDGWNSSSVASATVTIPSGVSGGTVTLFDLEDHKWSYYSDEECPIHSLNPADVKITYYGNGTNTVTNASAEEAVENPTSFSLNATTVKVGPNDDANVFVYYKTLERENVDGTGNVPYTTIPNPFLVRPTGNSSTVTITPTYRTVYLSWSCNNWTYNGAQAEVTYTYTDPDGKQQSGSGTSNGNTTIQVKAGTKVTLTSKGSRAPSVGNNRSNYQPTITAKLNNNTGEQIGSVTSTTTTAKSSETNAVTASSQTITTSTYRGFYAWRVKSKSEGLSIKDVNGNSFENNIIPADTEIRFVTSNEYGNEVEFEALWAQAYVTDGTSDLSTSSNSYERNFHVVKSATSASSFQKSYPLTVTSYYPDGTSAGGSVTGEFTAAADTKFENITISNATNSTWTANGHDLIVGRGCSGTVNYVRGISENITNPNYTIRLESGTYNYFSTLRGYQTKGGTNGTDTGSSMGGTPSIKVFFGCDYDRATNTGITDNLAITNGAYYGYSVSEGNNITYSETAFYAIVKSGKIGKGFTIDNSYAAKADGAFYIGIAGERVRGCRNLLIEGGQIASIAGGIDNSANQDKNSIKIRMKGGHVRGVVYGGGARSAAYGNRSLIFTGGTVTGWIGGGCNGEPMSANQSEDTYGGITHGASCVYFGGNAICGGEGSNVSINGSIGGIVFGAGKGVEGNTTSGRMANGTTVAIADNCNVQRDVYGGGNFGYAQTSTNIFVGGGTVQGGVFGGSNKNNGPVVSILMKDGTIEGGVYGGSNDTGAISNNVTMQINGGQVGTPSAPANIHGGGYGKDTKVDGNVTLTLGSNTTDPGVTVYGDVYGGSALGTVNDANSDKTEVTLNCGTINGSLYGGGLGDATNAAAVNGKVTVTTNGGRVTGAVYGCNNVNGAPANTVTVNINNTATPLAGQEFALNAVYGGGNKANYTYNVGPVVNVYAGYVANVFGGGNEATVAKTDVNIFGGHLLGNVYGGGNKADITTGGTDVDVTGGRIYNVFGGNNESGNITGEVHVDIANTSLSVAAVGVTDIDYVYGGGNLAAYSNGNGYPIVNMLGGTVREAIFGGGYGESAIVTGNPQVNVSGGTVGSVITIDGIQTILGDIYGGGNMAPLNGNPVVTLSNNANVWSRVFGGGNNAQVTGNTNVTMSGGVVGYTQKVGERDVVRGGDIFGGGNAATIEGETNVRITNGRIGHNVYGGGNEGNVTGKTNVKVGE